MTCAASGRANPTVAGLQGEKDLRYVVISGPKAQYKGTGIINGAGDYGFLLTANDGAVKGGGGVDQFRIKIWDKNNGDAFVYDNKMGASDGNGSPSSVLCRFGTVKRRG